MMTRLGWFVVCGLTLLLLGASPPKKRPGPTSRASGVSGKCPEYHKALCVLWRQCRQGKARACGRLGWEHYFGTYGRVAYGKAQAAWRTGCRARQPSALACHGMGRVYFKGLDVKKHYAKAERFFLKADGLAKKECKKGINDGCYVLARHRERGWGAAKDFKSAIRLYTKSCFLKHASSCNNLGLMHDSGQGVPKSDAKALYYFRIGCKLKEANACGNLGVMYDNGEGVKKSYAKANFYFQLSCRYNGGTGCYNLGLLYYNGQGTTRDFGKAAIYFRRACILREEDGCLKLARMYAAGRGVKRNCAEANALYKKACRNGKPLACSMSCTKR